MCAPNFRLLVRSVLCHALFCRAMAGLLGLPFGAHRVREGWRVVRKGMSLLPISADCAD